MIALGCLLMIYGLVWFAFLWRREYTGSLVITPLLMFGLRELVFVWPTTAISLTDGYYKDGYFFCVVGGTFLAFLAGFTLMRSQQAHVKEFVRLPLVMTRANGAYLSGTVAVLAVLFAAGLYQYQGMPPVVRTITSIASGNVDTSSIAAHASESRLSLTKGAWFGGESRGIGVVRDLARYGWPFIAGVAWILFLRTRRLGWLGITLGSCAAMFLFVGGDSTRGPLMWSVVLIVAGLSHVRRFSLRGAAIALCGLIVLMLALSLISAKGIKKLESGSVGDEMIPKIVDRLFLGNGRHNLATVDFVRIGALEQRNGRVHLERAVSSIPGVRFGTPFAHELFLLIHPTHSKRTTFATSTYLGILYLDFGFAGSILGYFLMGVLVALSYRWLYDRRMRTCDHVGRLAVYVILVGKMSASGPLGVLPSVIVFGVVDMTFRIAAEFHAGLGKRLTRPRPSHAPSSWRSA